MVNVTHNISGMLGLERDKRNGWEGGYVQNDLTYTIP